MRAPWSDDVQRVVSTVLPPMVALATVAIVGWLSLASGSMVDIATFRSSALAVLDGQSPYVAATVPFVYPPAAILAVLPAAIGPTLESAVLVWTAVSFAALGRTTWILVREAWPELDPQRRRNRVLWIFSALCVLEPTFVTLFFGQVGLLLLWMSVEGLGGLPNSRARTWLVGAAAAIKLTPGLILVTLAAAGRWRSVAWGIAGFVGATIVAGAVSPSGMRDYVSGAWRLAYEVNARVDAQNHSLLALAELSGMPRWIGLLAAALTLIVGVAIASRLWRRGDELAGTATVLITALMVSPVSWGHHWVAAYPALVLVLRDLRDRRLTSNLLLWTAVIGMLLWVDIVELGGGSVRAPDETWSFLTLLQREWWLVWGVAFLAWSAVPLLRPTASRADHPDDAGVVPRRECQSNRRSEGRRGAGRGDARPVSFTHGACRRRR